MRVVEDNASPRAQGAVLVETHPAGVLDHPAPRPLLPVAQQPLVTYPPRSMASRRPRYAIVSPARNEGRYARRTLESVVAQTLPPARWVIVDDGSSDDTPQILREYAKAHDYIEIVRRADRGRRCVGPGVIEAFCAGLDHLRLDEYDYLCKLDLDLELPRRYFGELVRRMEANPRMGTCSGKPYFPVEADADKGFGGRLVTEGVGDEVSVGASKFYRVACFRQIGGLVCAVMWDGIDCHAARMKGWMAHSWDEPDLRFIHLRPMGSSERGILTGRMRHGAGQYFMGTTPAFMVASAISRMTRRPYVVGASAMLWGYVRSALRKEKRYENPEFRKFLRRYQWACLFMGKRRATARIEERCRRNWRPDAIS